MRRGEEKEGGGGKGGKGRRRWGERTQRRTGEKRRGREGRGGEGRKGIYIHGHSWSLLEALHQGCRVNRLRSLGMSYKNLK